MLEYFVIPSLLSGQRLTLFFVIPSLTLRISSGFQLRASAQDNIERLLCHSEPLLFVILSHTFFVILSRRRRISSVSPSFWT